MAKQVIISTPRGNVNGTPLDDAFTMCNDNFTELYDAPATEVKFSKNSVLIGQGGTESPVDSTKTTDSFMQIPISDGPPSDTPTLEGAMYYDKRDGASGLYISNSAGTYEKVTTSSPDAAGPADPFDPSDM